MVPRPARARAESVVRTVSGAPDYFGGLVLILLGVWLIAQATVGGLGTKAWKWWAWFQGTEQFAPTRPASTQAAPAQPAPAGGLVPPKAGSVGTI